MRRRAAVDEDVREDLEPRSMGGVYERRCILRRAADRIKIIAWDGSGLVLVWKRLEHGAFKWPPITDGVMHLTPPQLAVLLDGMDWSRLHARHEIRPTATS